MRMLTMLALAITMAVGAASSHAQSKLTDGTVTKIDLSAGKITVRHGPMKKFDMEDPMTMIYRVHDPSMLKAVKPGDRVKFDAEQVNGRFTVTEIRKAR